MTDGFTTPSGADPDDNDDEPNGPPLTEQFESIPDDPDMDGDEELVVVRAEASCTDCSHREVCAIYNNFAQTLENSFNEEMAQGTDGPPTEPDKLAWHCRLYDPEE